MGPSIQLGRQGAEEELVSALLRDGLGFRFGRVRRLLRDGWAAQISDLGVTPVQAMLLRAVTEQPGSGLRQIGRYLHIDPMSAKRILDGLEAKGLVSSSQDPADRRVRRFEATASGRLLSDQLAKRSQKWDQWLASQLGDPLRQHFSDGIKRLQDALERSSGRG